MVSLSIHSEEVLADRQDLYLSPSRHLKGRSTLSQSQWLNCTAS